MKNVIITGSAGFLGSHIVEYLLDKTYWNIIGFDSFKHRGDSERVISSPRYQVECIDLNAPVSDRLIARLPKIDYIINCASESHVDRSITDPVPFVQNNVNLVLNMLEFARKVKPTHFFQISTDEVYGAALQGENHAEWSRIMPSNPYSASKAAQESIAYSYWRTYGVPIVITNTMNLIGERQDAEKFVPMCIKKINAGEVVTIHGSENYIGTRKYLYCKNMADAILFLANTHKPQAYYDNISDHVLPSRFNVVGDIELDNLSLAKMIANILGKELHYSLVDFHAARPGHDRRYSLDGTRMARLGWKSPFTFEDSLKRICEWTLKNKQWLN